MAKYAILQNFYASKEWITFRIGLIVERSVDGVCRCEKCGKDMPKSIEIHAHHDPIELTPENVKDKNISLNPDNVKLICRDCHDKEHYRFGYKPKKKVYIVYGPPLAGKKTLVRDQAKRGDIVIDIDRLYEAVSYLPSYDKPDNLLSNVMQIHNTLIDNIKTRYGKWNNAWIIGGYEDKYKRDRLAEELGAELIYCEATKEECIDRLNIDVDRQYRKDEWIKYINKWFERYSE